MSRNIRFFFGSRLFAIFARSHYTSLISMAWRAVSVAHHFNEIMVYKTDLLSFRVCASGAMRMLRTTPSKYPRSHAIIRSRAKDERQTLFRTRLDMTHMDCTRRMYDVHRMHLYYV